MYGKNMFYDTILTMGCRSSAQICHRVTNSIAYIMFMMGMPVLNYLDDLAYVEQFKKMPNLHIIL
jgi:hypothetical protein